MHRESRAVADDLTVGVAEVARLRVPQQPRNPKSGDFGYSPGDATMKCDLNGKVSLVTGAARGIGQAIADRLAANGSRVIYTDIDAGVEQAARRTPGAKAFTMDVTNGEQIENVIGRVVAECGSLDILVNNAGVNTLAHRVTIDSFPKDEWDRIVSVDLTGLYQVSRAG